MYKFVARPKYTGSGGRIMRKLSEQGSRMLPKWTPNEFAMDPGIIYKNVYGILYRSVYGIIFLNVYGKKHRKWRPMDPKWTLGEPKMDPKWTQVDPKSTQNDP